MKSIKLVVLKIFQTLDKHFTSRKFAITVFSMLLIVVAFLIAGKSAALGAQFPVAVGAILGALATYVGGNVIDAKTQVTAGKVPPPPVPPGAPKAPTPPPIPEIEEDDPTSDERKT